MALTKIGKEGITGISNASDATAITITSGENVGIGTTNPVADFVVSNGGAAGIELQPEIATDTNRITNFDRAASAYMNFKLDALTHQFLNSGTERMRITSAGVVCIGSTTTDPIANASSSIAITGAGNIGINKSGGVGLDIGRSSSDGAVVGFYRGTSQVGTISVTGSNTAYNTSSDYRLKENVDYTWNATTRLKQLKPARFNFIADDTNTLVDGFIAHEVSSIVPEAITGAKDAVDADNNPEYQGIDQSKLVPLLVKTIQELEARITALEA